MNVMLNTYVTGVLVSQAIEKVAIRFPFFPGLMQSHELGTPFASPATEEVPAKDLIEGFQVFNHEVYQLITKLTRTRNNGLQEARVIGKAFTEMVKELHVKCRELQDQPHEPVPPAEPVGTPPGGPEPSPTTESLPVPQMIQEREEENEKLKRALYDLHEEVGVLASTLSHHLTQPLRAIHLLCQFLDVEYISHLDAQARGYLQSIEQAGRTMRELIDDVVHYARITSASNLYEEAPLSQLVEQVRKDLSPILAERGATLQVVGELPMVTCDRERFKELLTELTTNAIKFNEQPQPVVEIGVAKEEIGRYTFYLKDHGIGIDEPYHESIFQLFYRLHQPEQYGGTGAGLAVCRRIVESHGGCIWVQSQLGAGATFFFTLPRRIPSI
jgi:C4-dicarboxylate-specific signal transduction histidine kinase